MQGEINCKSIKNYNLPIPFINGKNGIQIFIPSNKNN